MEFIIEYLEKEHNRRANEEIMFRQFLENMPLYMFSIQGDRFTYANPATLATLGYSMEELVKLKWCDVVHPYYREMMIERNRKRLSLEPVPHQYEIIITDKNHEEHWIEILNAKIEVNGVASTISAAVDITIRKQMEAELQKNQNDLEQRVIERTAQLNHTNQEISITNDILNNIITNMSDGLLIIDIHGNVEHMNPRSRDILKEGLDYLKACAENKGKSQLWRMLNQGQPFQDEEIMLTTKKGNIHFLASGAPIHNKQGDIHRGVIIVRPIKEVHKLVNRFTGAKATFRFEDIVFQSIKMRETIEYAKKAASKQSNVLLEGESGTGKELFAQAIHNNSKCSKGPFVAVNCGAIPRELIASELFGYAEGAFTGAKKGGNPGKFELASGGTIFLDEIGDMPLEEQTALLRVIQEKSITRIGGSRLIPVDVRIICASNKNLHEQVIKGNFRQDLFYRLHVLTIKIPPLRERAEDIPILLNYFLTNTHGFTQKHLDQIDPVIYERFSHYEWPGNVRELQNMTERLVNSANGQHLQVEHLPPEFTSELLAPTPLHLYSLAMPTAAQNRKTRALVAQIEREEIIQLLSKHHGNVSRVAMEMGVNRRTIHRKIKSYGITCVWGK